jgi:hypothetical protein
MAQTPVSAANGDGTVPTAAVTLPGQRTGREVFAPDTSVGGGWPQRRRELVLHGAVGLGCLLLAVVVALRTTGAVPDDALITFRYAQNLLHGHGWVYNLHRPTTDAASAPLYTVLLVAFGFVVRSVSGAASVLFVFTTAALGYLGFALLRRHGLTAGGLVAACLLIVNPWLLATRGMETSMFVALLLLAALMTSMQRYGWAGFALAAATFVRGDGAAVLAAALVFLLLRTRRVPWRFLLGAAAAAVPWALFATLVIGSPIPDTLGAKAAQGKSGLWGSGYVYVHGLSVIPSVFHFTGWALAMLVVGVPGVVLAFTDAGLRRSVGPFLVGAAVIFAVYGFVLKTPAYHWYYGPQIAALTLCAGIAVGFAVRALGRLTAAAGSAPGAGRGPVAGVSVAVALVLVLGALGWRQSVRSDGLQHYAKVARWLKSRTPSDAAVASTEIGAVGWYSDRDMVDYLGLLSKASVDEITRGDVVSWLAREQPDYWIVHQPAWYFEAAVAQPWFALAYRPVWTDGTLVVWQRVRSATEARALESRIIEPATAGLAAQLSAGTNTASRQALARLVALFATTPQLQAVYGHGGKVDVKALLAWASGAGPDSAMYGAAVQHDAATYHALASRANHSLDTLPVITTA